MKIYAYFKSNQNLFKIVICLQTFFVLISSNSSIAQLNPLDISINIGGFLKITPNPNHRYLYQQNLVKIDTNNAPSKVRTYHFINNADSILESVLPYNYMYDNIIVFTAYKSQSVNHFPRLSNEFQIKNLDNKISIIEHLHHNERRGKSLGINEFVLHYNKQLRLKKIVQLYNKDATDSRSIINKYVWKYAYSNQKLIHVDLGDTHTKYSYDTQGNLISAVKYTGNLKKMNAAYLCLDSLESYHNRKLKTYLVWDFYRMDHCEIHEMVFFKYENGKLMKMLCYDFNAAIKKTIIHYDENDRVIELYETHELGANKLNFS